MSQELQSLLIPFRRDKKRDFAVGRREAGAEARAPGQLTRGAGPGVELVSLGVEENGAALTLRVRVRERDQATSATVTLER